MDKYNQCNYNYRHLKNFEVVTGHGLIFKTLGRSIYEKETHYFDSNMQEDDSQTRNDP